MTHQLTMKTQLLIEPSSHVDVAISDMRDLIESDRELGNYCPRIDKASTIGRVEVTISFSCGDLADAESEANIFLEDFLTKLAQSSESKVSEGSNLLTLA